MIYPEYKIYDVAGREMEPTILHVISFIPLATPVNGETVYILFRYQKPYKTNFFESLCSREEVIERMINIRELVKKNATWSKEPFTLEDVNTYINNLKDGNR